MFSPRPCHNSTVSALFLRNLTTNLTMNFMISSIFIPRCSGFPKNHKNLSSIFPQHVVELRRYMRNNREKDGIYQSNVLIWPFADWVNPRKTGVRLPARHLIYLLKSKFTYALIWPNKKMLWKIPPCGGNFFHSLSYDCSQDNCNRFLCFPQSAWAQTLFPWKESSGSGTGLGTVTLAFW